MRIKTSARLSGTAAAYMGRYFGYRVERAQMENVLPLLPTPNSPRSLVPSVARLLRNVIAMIGKLVLSTNTGNIRRKNEQNCTG